ncbi:MAG: AraC family transcriptional regulator [Aquabacterium sp.]|jgi:AraC-like DNA-binding protein|uniref:AraC family transcriptional regulator n=1 Tax=Aquabacterium sp. TaxID=1872578 RepID=UPI003BAEE02D
MDFLDFRCSAASVRILVEAGQARGFKPPQILAGTGLRESDLLNPDAELNARQELRAVENLIRACTQPGLGLEVGLRGNLASYGFWGLGLISSATAGDALAFGLRYVPLSFPFCRISVTQEGGLRTISFGEPALAPDVQQFLVERDMAAAALLMKEALGSRFVLSRFQLKHGLRTSATVSRDIEVAVGTRPRFGARDNSLSFEQSMLGWPLPQADPVTVALCEKACADLMERWRVRLGAGERLRQHLGMAPLDAMPTLVQSAQWLGLSERTLKRRLQDEGTTFSALLAQARSGQARALVADGDLPLTQIAERMGFSDLSSFSQAFKRWFGVAPSVLRKTGK